MGYPIKSVSLIGCGNKEPVTDTRGSVIFLISSNESPVGARLFSCRKSPDLELAVDRHEQKLYRSLFLPNLVSDRFPRADLVLQLS